MVKKILYFVGKILNWVLPIGLLMLSVSGYGPFDAYRYPDGTGVMTEALSRKLVLTVSITFIIFWLVRFWAWRSGTDRIVYEIVVLIGMIIEIVFVCRAPRIYEWPYNNGVTEYSEAKLPVLFVIVTIVLSVLIVLVRIFTFMCETDRYLGKEESRKKRSLNYDVKLAKESVLIEQEYGNTRSYNKAKLNYEEAKEKRDRHLGLK